MTKSRPTPRACAANCRDGIPRTGLTLCRGCINRLRADLNSCEERRQELMITLAGQDRIGAPTEGHSQRIEQTITEDADGEHVSEQWLRSRPYDVRAANALHELRNELTTWVRLLADETGDPLPQNRIVSLAGWITAHRDHIAKHEAAGELVRGIRRALASAEAAIDLPLDKVRVKVGPCPEREPSDKPDELGDGKIWCPGHIWAYIPQDGPKGYRPALVCSHGEACNHDVQQWTTEQWARMGKRIQARLGVTTVATPDEKAVRRLIEAVMA